jgi:hypothetical protein
MVKEMRVLYDIVKNDPVKGPAFFSTVKSYSMLVDLKEIQSKIG